MLESIYIENFAIIDRLEVDFHNHMTVLTGENQLLLMRLVN